ncbi:hypothetical protein AB1Y20_005008 [Prymnesium parvum]|uniref:Iron hydrogenase large subunit C-terminal domain-containing protein n=1 Tax=Prymnesium parvum TaxID=97485 RepID=A0AB34J4P5_PRYPA
MDVKLSSAALSSDFISPSAACIKPIQIDQSKPNRHVLRLEGLQDEEEASAGRLTAKVTLNDCLACAGCITSAESVLVTQQSTAEFLRSIGAFDHIVISLSAAARAAIAVHAGLSLRETHGRLAGFFRRLGCHRLFDNGLASDLSLLQTAAEFIHRFRAAADPAAPREGAAVLPLLTSSCPGWVCYAEKVVGAAALPHMSCVKSPQQIMGTLLKYAHGAACGVPPERIYHVSVMPCFDKKLEASRDDFFNGAAGEHGARDVDCVLSAGEVVQLIEEKAGALALVDGCEPDRQPDLSGLSEDGALFTYAAPGGAGGYAEFVFRAAAAELFGVQELGPLQWKAGRNADVAELTLEQNGVAVLRFARAYGFRNIQNVVRRLKSGKSPYHFVELMACPGGCANGGGQPRPSRQDAMDRTQHIESAMVNPTECVQRSPANNPRVQALFAPGGFLEGGPAGAAAQRYLQTQFHVVTDSARDPLTISW